jgi:antitoxin (DNA-binding transcriptional repressor) of toxin-antitoxin stability system
LKASIVDLRYKMKNVLKALDRGEKVKILYHGKVKGIIHPETYRTNKKVKDHAFFGMDRIRRMPVSEEMEDLRGSRTDDL